MHLLTSVFVIWIHLFVHVLHRLYRLLKQLAHFFDRFIATLLHKTQMFKYSQRSSGRYKWMNMVPPLKMIRLLSLANIMQQRCPLEYILFIRVKLCLIHLMINMLMQNIDNMLTDLMVINEAKNIISLQYSLLQ